MMCGFKAACIQVSQDHKPVLCTFGIRRLLLATHVLRRKDLMALIDWVAPEVLLGLK